MYIYLNQTVKRKTKELNLLLSYIMTNQNIVLTRINISWKIEGYPVMSDCRK